MQVLDVGEMFRNQVLNLSEGRISVVQGVFEKPTTPNGLIDKHSQ